MLRESWQGAVIRAIVRFTKRRGHWQFTRQELIREELESIVAAVGCRGRTPGQTLSYVLQGLRDLGMVEFLGRGVYRLRVEVLRRVE